MKSKLTFELDLPRQVGEKNSCAFEHADQQDRLAGKIGGNARSQLGYLGRDLLARDQNSELVHFEVLPEQKKNPGW